MDREGEEYTEELGPVPGIPATPEEEVQQEERAECEKEAERRKEEQRAAAAHRQE